MPELDQWKLRTELRAWQVRALEAWSQAGHRGVVDAATGTGKSLVALAAIEEFVRAHDARARIVVVVPSLALARQWRSQLTEGLGVPQDEITEWHSNAPKSVGPPQRLVIAVIDSARKHIPEMIRKWNDEGHVTLLVVDECHRAGSAVNRKVFDVPPGRSLGLTATLERDDGGEEVVFDGVGPVCFSYSLLDALDDGVLAPIRSVNLYVDLTEAEQSDYDELTASLDSAMRQLRQEMFSAGRDLRSNLNEIRQLAVDGHAGAGRVMSLVGKRAHLVRHAANRRECVRSIAGWLATTQHNVIVFHESIAGAEQSHEAFRSVGLPTVLEHSDLPDDQRRQSANAFRAGRARVWVVVKSIDEGVDVPDASCALIVSCSGTERQRIQRFGRILRQRDGKKALAVSVLVRRTPEEPRVGCRDTELLGDARVRHHRWTFVASLAELVNAATSSFQPASDALGHASASDELVAQHLELGIASDRRVTPFEASDGKRRFTVGEVAASCHRSEKWVHNQRQRRRFESAADGQPDDISRTEADRLYDIALQENRAKAAAQAPQSPPAPTRRRHPARSTVPALTRDDILAAATAEGSADPARIAQRLGLPREQLSAVITADPMLKFRLKKVAQAS